MPATQPLYDLVLMLDTAADDDRRASVLQSVEQAVAKGGEIVNQQDWGARSLAFEIRHKKDAEYHLLQFHATPDLLAQLDRTLRITDEVVRFRVIKLAPGTPAPPDQRAEARAAGDGEPELECAEGAPAESMDAAPPPAPEGDAVPVPVPVPAEAEAEDVPDAAEPEAAEAVPAPAEPEAAEDVPAEADAPAAAPEAAGDPA
jgi:small subunit ribosomal protein S6